MKVSAWVRVMVRGRRDERRRFASPEELEEFFRRCDALDGPEREPDWSEHREIIDRSRAAGRAES